MQLSIGLNWAEKKLTIGRPERNCFFPFGRTYALGSSLPRPIAQAHRFVKGWVSLSIVVWMNDSGVLSRRRKTLVSAKVVSRHSKYRHGQKCEGMWHVCPRCGRLSPETFA